MEPLTCYRMIGLAKKAGKLHTGEHAAFEAVKHNEAKLVVLAGDASLNTAKRFHDKCAYREIPLVVCGTKETLGHALGRTEISVAALSDEGFAKAILNTKEEYKEKI